MARQRFQRASTDHIDTALPREVVDDGPAWQDLSQNRAGQAVRERAVELRAEAPVRAFAARVFGMHTDERAYRVGADGEEEVACRMHKLGDGWHVLHAVPLGEKDSDIDHVVIGPPGVFTLYTRDTTWRTGRPPRVATRPPQRRPRTDPRAVGRRAPK